MQKEMPGSQPAVSGWWEPRGARDSGEGNLCGEGTSQESLSEGHAGEPETEEARRGQAGEEGVCCL